MFTLRNAGNIVPAFPHCGGEIATIEFAIEALGIRDIIICGHSDCGAMKGLLQSDKISESMPNVARWLKHAEHTRDGARGKRDHPEDPITAIVEENVLVQIDNLKTHHFIKKHLDSGRIHIYGWYYKFETGEVFQFDPKSNSFITLNQGHGIQTAVIEEAV
jgi:carbonic anhydrase